MAHCGCNGAPDRFDRNYQAALFALREDFLEPLQAPPLDAYALANA